MVLGIIRRLGYNISCTCYDEEVKVYIYSIVVVVCTSLVILKVGGRGGGHESRLSCWKVYRFFFILNRKSKTNDCDICCIDTIVTFVVIRKKQSRKCHKMYHDESPSKYIH